MQSTARVQKISEHWFERNGAQVESKLDSFLRELNLPNSIFVYCVNDQAACKTSNESFRIFNTISLQQPYFAMSGHNEVDVSC